MPQFRQPAGRARRARAKSWAAIRAGRPPWPSSTSAQIERASTCRKGGGALVKSQPAGFPQERSRWRGTGRRRSSLCTTARRCFRQANLEPVSIARREKISALPQYPLGLAFANIEARVFRGGCAPWESGLVEVGETGICNRADAESCLSPTIPSRRYSRTLNGSGTRRL